jgi:hypothetical protein
VIDGKTHADGLSYATAHALASQARRYSDSLGIESVEVVFDKAVAADAILA